jgi:type VI secretion system protein ImpC
MPGRLEFDASFGRRGGQREESEPMRLLVLGDFSAKPVEERAPLASRPILRVDVDNVEDLMRRVDPRANSAAAEIHFHQIDDFHPDRLFARLDLFRALRDVRASPPAEHDEQLARLLGTQSAPNASSAPPPAGSLDALIHDAVAPHVVKDTSARTASHVAAADAAIAHEMRTLLHDPAFQRIEAAWRGLRWLIAGLELDENLQLHLLDVTREELLADIVTAQGKLARTNLYRAVIDRLPRGDSWSALVGLFRFGPSTSDIGLLAALGLIASNAGGPFFGDGDLALAADDEQALAGWQMLRRSEAAPWIGLAAPRLLLRQPYGQRTDPIDAFGFEELAGAPASDELLWGHASLAMALLIGRAFSARGWDMEPGDEREIGDLPVYTFVRDGEREMQPCTERVLSERDTNRLLAAGLIPIASRRDRDQAVVVRFQSVADPSAPLAWSR